MHTAGSNQT